MGKTVKQFLAEGSSKRKRNNDKGRGSKKYGRHKAHCQKYLVQNRREKNKARKQRKIEKMLTKKAKRKERKGK